MPLPLITPDDVVDHLIAVLAGPAPLGRLEEKFATLERVKGLAPMSLGRVWPTGAGAPPVGLPDQAPFTVDHLAGEGFRERKDKPPCALIGLFGDSAEPLKGNARPIASPTGGPASSRGMTLGMTWTIAVEVTVIGQSRRDVLQRRDWYGYTVAQCLLQHTERKGDPLDAFALIDADLTSGAEGETSNTLAQARFIFEAVVHDALPLTPEFRERPDDPYVPPGSEWIDSPLHGRHTVERVPIMEGFQ